MKVYDDEKNDFTPEYMLQFATLAEMVFGAELIGEQIIRALDVAHYRGSFLQKRRQSLNRASQAAKTIVREYEFLFDDAFNKTFVNHGVRGYDALHQYAIDLVQICLTYVSRSTGDDDKTENMKRALHNFKNTDAEKDFGDVDAVLRLYNMK